MNKALFLDLDHTLIRPKSGATFPKDSEDWEWMPAMLDALRSEVKAAGEQPGAHIILVTNQGGVAAGHHAQAEIEQKLMIICRELREAIGCPVHWYACYTMHGYDRKPSPGLAYRAALEFHLDLPSCMMIGDMDSDREFAIAAGIGRYMDVRKYLPYPEDAALIERAGCPNYNKCSAVHHCDCWHEAGMPNNKFGTGLAPVAYKQHAPVFTPGKIDHSPIG